MNFKSGLPSVQGPRTVNRDIPGGVKCIVGFLAITADAYTSGHVERTWQVPKMGLIGTALGWRLMMFHNNNTTQGPVRA